MAYAPPAPPERTQQRGITRDEFEALIARGAFDDDARVELIDGVINMKPRPSPEHSAVVRALNRLFRACDADVDVQSPLEVGGQSFPLPDLAVVRSPGMHAHPEGALLVVEVVVSRWREAQLKVPVYAAGGVGTYWIVDVNERRVLVHADADAERREYRRVREFRGGDVLRVPESDVAFSVDELFAVAERRSA
ncbi:MAG TPA: Uma2 family endonuclease [Solirubrobacteraceae bacterium]|nr:Uma2 family endonuclease [Solirubrobacteraceae bacterium]